MGDLCDFDEAYGVDESGSDPVIVERTFSCSICPFWFVTSSIEFSAYRWSFKGENIRRKLKLKVHLHLVTSVNAWRYTGTAQ